LSIFSLYLG
jgi:hypothetical protein